MAVLAVLSESGQEGVDLFGQFVDALVGFPEALIRLKQPLASLRLLLAHQGVANQSIAEQLNLSRPTILALREAYPRDGITAVPGIRKRKRQGRVLTPELEQKILDTTLKTRPGSSSIERRRSTVPVAIIAALRVKHPSNDGANAEPSSMAE